MIENISITQCRNEMIAVIDRYSREGENMVVEDFIYVTKDVLNTLEHERDTAEGEQWGFVQ